MMKKKPIPHDDLVDGASESVETDSTATQDTLDAASAFEADPTTGAEAYIVALQAELTDERKTSEEAEKRVLYVQAEFQNYRRRKEEEFKDVQRYANGELMLGILPVVDSFERALAAAEQTRNIDALLAGLAGTLKQLQSVLNKAGVKAIDSIGKEFDPKFHEAIGHTESDEYPPHTVAEEVQRGYMIHDRILRPALVKVTED